ncbi:hypothetical protein C8R46DRAFT_6544 [Mycena filopes]|nr:hypothetical protein C8R46DRAFT_6544 [Mycena filopes]
MTFEALPRATHYSARIFCCCFTSPAPFDRQILCCDNNHLRLRGLRQRCRISHPTAHYHRYSRELPKSTQLAFVAFPPQLASHLTTSGSTLLALRQRPPHTSYCQSSSNQFQPLNLVAARRLTTFALASDHIVAARRLQTETALPSAYNKRNHNPRPPFVSPPFAQGDHPTSSRQQYPAAPLLLCLAQAQRRRRVVPVPVGRNRYEYRIECICLRNRRIQGQ